MVLSKKELFPNPISKTIYTKFQIKLIASSDRAKQKENNKTSFAIFWFFYHFLWIFKVQLKKEIYFYRKVLKKVWILTKRPLAGVKEDRGRGMAGFRRGESLATRAEGPESNSKSWHICWMVWMGRGMAGGCSSAMAQSTAAEVNGDEGGPAKEWQREVVD